MVFFEKDHKTVAQLDPLWRRGIERGERRDRNFSPWLGMGGDRCLRLLCERDADTAEQRSGEKRCATGDGHRAPAWACCGCLGSANSIIAYVRLFSTNILFATLRTSALVTASIFCNWLNNSRQSPYCS